MMPSTAPRGRVRFVEFSNIDECVRMASAYMLTFMMRVSQKVSSQQNVVNGNLHRPTVVISTYASKLTQNPGHE